MAWGSSLVHAPNTNQWDHPTVEVKDHAVFVNRANGKPQVFAITGAVLVTHDEVEA